MKWKYTDTDGRPKKAGVYWAAVIFNGWDKEKQQPNNELFVMVDTRYFGDAKAEDLESWKMNGEPDEGLVWTEETGSFSNERVWAWAEIEETPFPERLPDGVKKYEYN